MRALTTRSTAVAAAVGAFAALTLSLGSTAQAAEAGATGVDCWGSVHANDTHLGIVGCTNNTGAAIEFRAEVVCGWAPDASGSWVSLQPGQYGESKAQCAIYSSGVGSVGWTIR